jgi:hypothetical protein
VKGIGSREGGFFCNLLQPRSRSGGSSDLSVQQTTGPAQNSRTSTRASIFHPVLAPRSVMIRPRNGCVRR